MNRQRRLATWSGVILGTFCAIIFMAADGNASDRHFTEEFHQTYALSAGGRVELDNINGAVHITGWDQNQVKVDAVKYAGTKERLDEAKIEVNAGSDYVSIHTEYPDRTQTFTDDESNNPASVEYTLTVPRSARLDEIKLINGSLDISGVNGEVRASSINGRLQAKELAGRVKLSTINGHLDADFARVGDSPLELSSVNGSVALTLPSDARAEIEASTIHGGIENDFGLTTHDHRYVGHDLHGELGSGGTRIDIHNVNGHIDIRRSGGNQSASPARDLEEKRHADKDDDDDDNI